MKKHILHLIAYIFATAFVTGCGKQDVLMGDLIANMTNTLAIASLDSFNSHILTSYDPSGGNDDFNHFQPGKAPDGWRIVADLKGPGFVSRLWFTGNHVADYKLRFYFDGEQEPRIQTTLEEWCGQHPQMPPPIAAEENNCFYNLAPLPYAKRLQILVEAPREQDVKFYYQVNYSPLPKGTTIQSFAGTYPPEEAAALLAVQNNWLESGPTGDLKAEKLPVDAPAFTIQPRQQVNLWEAAGPAIITNLTIQFPDGFSSLPQSTSLLRDLIIRIYWDGQPVPSVEVPLGDFFGTQFQISRHRSLYWSIIGNTFSIQFPMPFQQAARLSIENASLTPVELTAQVDVRTRTNADTGLGYFHAAWRKSGPAPGTAHDVLRANGRGRLAACLLSAIAADINSGYWVLESDEFIRRDKETSPGWPGTGLEDYFNGGWYYQTVMVRPLHGITYKAPFKTSQYRIHQTDPVLFQDSLDMYFERGSGNTTPSWMESVAYYYMESPQRAYSNLNTPVYRQASDTRLAPYILTHELWNLERFRDLPGSMDRIQHFLSQYPTSPDAEMLRFRLALIREFERGGNALVSEYEQWMQNADSESVRQAASNLFWQAGGENRMLLHAYSGSECDIYLDGRLLLKTQEGEPRTYVIPLELEKGTHTVATRVKYRPYPCGVQIILADRDGIVASTRPGWTYQFNPSGTAWTSRDFDDSSWPVWHSGMKGPPDDNEIYVPAEPYLFIHSQASPIIPKMERFVGGHAGMRMTFEYD